MGHIGNGLHGLGYGLNVLGNGPYMLGIRSQFRIMLHSALYVTFGVMSFEICHLGLCCIRGFVFFCLMSHLALCHNQTYVVWDCFVHRNVVQHNVVCRNIVQPAVGVSQDSQFPEPEPDCNNFVFLEQEPDSQHSQFPEPEPDCTNSLFLEQKP